MIDSRDSMKTAFIYFLGDPRNLNKGYVGKTGDPKTRLPRHLSESRKKNFHRANWICALVTQGLKPTFDVIAEVEHNNWEFWERSYIRLYRGLGFELVNKTPGGEGTGSGKDHPQFGIPRSEETKRKVSESKKGCKAPQHSPEILNKISAALRNKKKPHNRSGFVGISWHKITGKWTANFRASRKQQYVGIFSKLEDAIFARALALYNYEN